MEEDININITREKYEGMCKEPIEIMKSHFKTLIDKITSENITVQCIEVVGGGSNIFFIIISLLIYIFFNLFFKNSIC